MGYRVEIFSQEIEFLSRQDRDVAVVVALGTQWRVKGSCLELRYDKYGHELEKDLEAVAPFILKGEITLMGEDGEKHSWRFEGGRVRRI